MCRVTQLSKWKQNRNIPASNDNYFELQLNSLEEAKWANHALGFSLLPPALTVR